MSDNLYSAMMRGGEKDKKRNSVHIMWMCVGEILDRNERDETEVKMRKWREKKKKDEKAGERKIGKGGRGRGDRNILDISGKWAQ